MKVPDHLAHKPITAVEEYDLYDGHYANNTDVKALSVGIAQYDGNEISAKVLRHSGGKWSRQSEELPLHRVLDLASTVLQSVLLSDGKKYPSTPFTTYVHDPAKLSKIKDYYRDYRHIILPKLLDLKDTIDYFLKHEDSI